MPSRRWLENLVQTSQLASGAIDFPPGVQWTGRTPLWFPLRNLVLWGMGPLLGLAACAATIAAAYRLFRHDARHTIPVLWIALVFLHQGSQFVTTGRYFLPMYPMLALLAAWGLVALRDRSPARFANAAIGVVLAGTLLWAVAFTSIYRRPNTRVEASRWIYRNVPAGATLATEHWDDRLPLRLAGTAPEQYAGVDLTNYDDDTPEKLDRLLQKLDAAQYVILASNRLYDSIPRLPMRYPMTTKYYRFLFSGELGFERVADFTSFPALGRFRIPDQSAEEAFTVYDHARVQIFARTRRWDPQRARALVGDVDWNAVVRMPAARAGQFRNGLLLPAAAQAAVRDGGTWSRMFDPGGFANRHPILVWSLLLELLGLAAFPLTALAFRAWPDRGWLIAKSVGLLLVSYGGWLLASLGWLPFTRATLLLVVAGLVLAAAATAWNQRGNWAGFWRERRRLLIGEEVFFWACFLFFLIVRAGNPDLWHPNFGGEKPMDFAYLNAIVRSESFPPYDPWFAGGYINYYYFGFVLVAALTKMSGIVPQVAYNLAIPTFFALTAGGAFTVAHAMATAVAVTAPAARPWRLLPWGAGITAAGCVTVLGNLVEAGLLRQALTDPSSREWPSWIWYWNATRVIPHTASEAPPITEFPFFTFLYGDLHAHMMALPYTLVALACGVALVLPPGRADRDHGDRFTGPALLALLGLVLGALYVTNTWDYPTYVLIAGCALLLRGWIREGAGWTARRVLIGAGARLLLVLALGRVLFAPFFEHYSQAYGSFLFWTGSRTPAAAYLAIHGLFLFTLITWAARQAASPRSSGHEGVRPMLAVMITVGLLLSLAVEIVVLANDTGRMNTVFKFYFQIWVLWGVATGVCLGWLVHEWQQGDKTRFARGAAVAWAMVLTGLCVSCAAYPVLATRARWADRFVPGSGFGLDGQAFMRASTHVERDQAFRLAPDLDAIRWLETEIPGTPVIVEAHTPEYRWGARIATHTGLPTILGWTWHQTQQRAALPADVVSRRVTDIDAIYNDTGVDRTRRILDRYRAEYVYVGALERIFYSPEGLAKFENSPGQFQRVYDSGDVQIYRVVR